MDGYMRFKVRLDIHLTGCVNDSMKKTAGTFHLDQLFQTNLSVSIPVPRGNCPLTEVRAD